MLSFFPTVLGAIRWQLCRSLDSARLTAMRREAGGGASLRSGRTTAQVFQSWHLELGRELLKPGGSPAVGVSPAWGPGSCPAR